MNFIKEQFQKEKEAGKRIYPKLLKIMAWFFGVGGILSLFSGDIGNGILMILFAYFWYSLSKRLAKKSS